MIIDALRQDLRYALRALRTHPTFAATVVVTIALGMGANATMFGIVDRLLFRGPDQVRDPESVVGVQTSRRGSQFGNNTTFSYAAYTDYRAQPGSFSAVAAASRSNPVSLGRGRDASRIMGALVSASMFDVLGVRPALGRFFRPDEDDERQPHTVAVIGYGFWQRHFGGGRNALGSSLEIGSQKFEVIGVAPKGFTGPEFTNVDVWLLITGASGLRFDSSPTWMTNRGNTWLSIIARLRPGATEQIATAQATAVHRASLRRRLEAEPKSARFIVPDSEDVVLEPLVPGKAHGYVGGVAPQDVKISRLLGIVSLIVLVIACANVANLLLVRAVGRRREIAVRLALGVSRGRLVSQLLVEGLLLALLGGVGALMIAYWTSHGVQTLLLGADAVVAQSVDGRLLAFTGIMALATGVITSLVPALTASHTSLAVALKAGAREGGGQHSPVRTTLLVVQAALAILLLAGAGVFLRSLKNVDGLPMGVDFDHVLVADIRHKAAGLSSADAHRLFEQFASDVKRLPGIRSSAVAVGLPLSLNWGTELIVPGQPTPKLKQGPSQYVVTPGYFETLGIPVVAGRAFDAHDVHGAAPVVIINEKAASIYLPQRNPIGQCVKVGGDTVPCSTIVGVVKNTIRQGLEDIVPQVYRPLDQLPESSLEGTVSFFGYELVVRTATDAGRYVETVRRAIQSAAPSVPYATVRPMRDLLGSRIRAWQLGARVFSALGLLALVLAAVGLYSVLAFTIAQRLHELGVRIALGAQSVDLVRLTLGKGLAPTVGGIAVGLVLVLLSGKFVESLLFNVSPRDPAVLGTVCAVLLGTAILASVAPAIRAARVDPATVLRQE